MASSCEGEARLPASRGWRMVRISAGAFERLRVGALEQLRCVVTGAAAGGGDRRSGSGRRRGGATRWGGAMVAGWRDAAGWRGAGWEAPAGGTAGGAEGADGREALLRKQHRWRPQLHKQPWLPIFSPATTCTGACSFYSYTAHQHSISGYISSYLFCSLDLRFAVLPGICFFFETESGKFHLFWCIKS